MGLSFLPEDVRSAVSNLNYNYISEIRLRRGQPVSVEYKGEFKYLTAIGVSDESKNAIVFGEIAPVINTSARRAIYYRCNFTENYRVFAFVGNTYRR